MVTSGMLRRVALVRTDVSEELSASFIRVTRIDELRTTLAITSNRRKLRRNTIPSSPILVTLMKEAQSSSETSVLTRTTRRNIPEDTILHSHRRDNLKSYLSSVSKSFRLQDRTFILCVPKASVALRVRLMHSLALYTPCHPESVCPLVWALSNSSPLCLYSCVALSPSS
jgi:hypothetical protein